MTQLGNQLRDLAEHELPPAIDGRLFDRARRRSRLRKVATAVTATAAAGTGFMLATGKSPAFTEGIGEPAGQIGALMGDGVVGWIVLAAVLAVSGLVWRRLPLGVLTRRLLAIATVGALLVLASPPGTALWAEPRDQHGLPDRLAEPDSWSWAADLRQSPPGRVSIVFSGRATHGDFEEGRIALLADNGDRYRTFDVFEDPLSGSYSSDYLVTSSILSPDGRYLASNYGTFDLTTGRRMGGILQEAPAAWSADSKRVVTRDRRSGTPLRVWDLPTQRMIREIPMMEPGHGAYIALSPTGDRMAAVQGEEIIIYPVDGGKPVRWLRQDWQLASTSAWSNDGTLLAMARTIECPGCPTSAAATQQLKLVDPLTGSVVDGGMFAQLPANTRLAVYGWRSPTELVAQVDGAVKIFARGSPEPVTLMTLPEGISRIEIARDSLADPIRPAGPATYGPPNYFLWLIAAAAAVVLILPASVIWLLVWAVRRRRRKRRVLLNA